MKHLLYCLLILTQINFCIAQIVSRSNSATEPLLQNICSNNISGYNGLFVRDTLGYSNICLVRLNDSLEVMWTKLFLSSQNANPVFLRQLPNSNFLIGSTSDSSSLIMETDSTGNILQKWNLNDSIVIKDAIRTPDGSTFLLFMKNNNSIPLGNLRSSGIGYINPGGVIPSLYWSPNISHHSDPVSFVESSNNTPFLIIHRESLNFWDCWLYKIDSLGNILNGERIEITYEIQLLKKQNNEMILSGETLLNNFGPTANFLIKTNANGQATLFKGIQFMNSNNNYQSLSGLKCIETSNGGLVCAGVMDGKISFFHLSSNFILMWAYTLDNPYYSANLIVSSSDNGFLIEGLYNNSDLIKCDSNGISNCFQVAAVCSLVTPSFFTNLFSNYSQFSLNFTNDTIQINPITSNYTLIDQCLTTFIQNPAIKQQEFIIFPNPCKNEFTIKLNIELAANWLRISNVFGVEVLSETFSEFTKEMKLNIEDLPAGIYFLSIGDKQHSFVAMFVKQ